MRTSWTIDDTTPMYNNNNVFNSFGLYTRHTINFEELFFERIFLFFFVTLYSSWKFKSVRRRSFIIRIIFVLCSYFGRGGECAGRRVTSERAPLFFSIQIHGAAAVEMSKKWVGILSVLHSVRIDKKTHTRQSTVYFKYTIMNISNLNCISNLKCNIFDGKPTLQ